MTQRPRNVRALAVTLAYVVLVVGLLSIIPPPCYTLVVASSNEKFGLLEDIAKKYSPPSVDRRCVTVKVTNKASGEAEEALARGWVESDGPLPHVWSPAADTWVLLLSQHRKEAGSSNLVPSVTPDLMLSPLVIGMPKPMADALAADAVSRGQGLGWSDMLRHAREPSVWGRLNRPEWGPFGLGKTNPNVSTSGLHALIATYHAATRRNEPPTLADLERFETREFVRGVESGVVHYAESVRTFLKNLYERDQRGEALTYFSALPIEEKQLFEYNRGNPESLWPPEALPRPRIQLVAVYPAEGTLAANHPYVVLNAPWVGDAHRQAAADFLAHLITPAVQERFCAEGFRDHHGFACTEPQDPGIDPNKPGSYLKLSEPAALARMQRSWSGLRKTAQVILAIDIGGSMADFLTSTNQTKLDLAKEAAIAALGRNPLAGPDEVGLWVFATNLDGDRAYREVVPLTRVDLGLEKLVGAIRGLQPVSGGKGLYATVLACVFDIRTRERPDRISAVVVLTDGRNDDPRNNDREGFLNILRDQSDDLRVRVFTIAYGGADVALLREIARESGGLFYDATDPTTITPVFRDVISNF